VIAQFAAQYPNTQFFECRFQKLRPTQSCYCE